MRVLVTGGAGYIGSNLVDALLAEGHEVRVLDDFSTGRKENIAHLGPEVRVVEGTILDHDVVDAEVEGCELVFHLAAAVGVGNIVAEPLRSMLVNVRGTEHVLESCSRHGARVVLASTSEVYGKTAKVPMAEDDDRVLGPTKIARWSYSTGKALDEHLGLAYHAERGLPVSIVRYFNSYGPRLHENGYGSVIAAFLGQALRNEPLTVHGDGHQTRSFTFVTDTVRGTILAGTHPDAIGTVFNIGNTSEITINEVAEKVLALTGSTAGVQHIAHHEQYGASFEDTRRRVPDIRRAGEVLGWAPLVSFDDGLARTLAWWRQSYR